MIKVYKGREYLKTVHDYWEAESTARFDFFCRFQIAWGELGLPKNYLLVYENIES